MDVWVGSCVGVLQIIKLLGTFLYVLFGAFMYVFLQGLYLGVQWLGQGGVYLQIRCLMRFPLWLYHFVLLAIV